MSDERKSLWDKVSIIGQGILVPLVLVVLSYILTQQGKVAELDADLMFKFREIYDQPKTDQTGGNSSRRLSPHIINRIASPCVREELRQFIVWDTLERNIPPQGPLSQPFRFDSENSDWHLLGDVLSQMRRDNKCSNNFDRWWSEDIKYHTETVRWPMHAKELAKLYGWLESIYIRQLPASVATQDGLGEWLAGLLISWHPRRWVVLILVGLYSSLIVLLILFAVHRGGLAVRFRFLQPDPPLLPQIEADPSQQVLVQLPVYNEQNVVRRVIDATARLDWPIENLQIQVLDDSTDKTSDIVAKAVAEYQLEGFRIQHLQRRNRENYKAGALAEGLKHSEASLICIFDADFEPPTDFLRKTIGHFSDQKVGMVQARWTHVNARHSWLTRLQAILLDGHFIVDQGERYRSECFFSFNGTAGVWRRQAIEEAGGWSTEMPTLTEDLDLSYRAQLARSGWKFVYRPDIEAPAELPVNMLSFKAQQRRWSCGSMQTARKLLRQIWSAKILLKCKLEATAHLLSNSAYTLVFMAGLLSVPVHMYGAQEYQALVFNLEVGLLIAGVFAIHFFHSVARSYTRRRRIGGLLYVVPILLLGMGMSVNNGLAAIRGAISQGGVFERTAKYGVDEQNERDERGGWWRSPYGAQRALGYLFVEVAVFLYMSLSVIVTWRYLRLSSFEHWHWLIFPVAFCIGLGYVLLMTLAHLFLQKGTVK